jgi:rhodanese-related sulfurtransferase
VIPRAVTVLALALALAAPARAEHPATAWALQTIDAEGLKRLLDSGRRVVVVDVGPPEEFRRGHIPGARSLSLDEPGDRFRQLPRGETIVLYCGCPESEIGPAYQFLRYSGYRDVHVLAGGLSAWAARGYPVAR